MAGYSGTPLIRKIGIKAGCTVVLADAPANFRAELGEIPEEVTFATRAAAADIVILFVDAQSSLRKKLSSFAGQIVPNGMIWVAWPKKSSGVATDLTENVVRDVGLAIGLVDVKVCAIDEIWSGLKFVYRVSERAKVGDVAARR